MNTQDKTMKKGSGSQNVETKRSLFTGEEIPKWSLREHKPKGERVPETRREKLAKAAKFNRDRASGKLRVPETRIPRTETSEGLKGVAWQDYWNLKKERDELLAALKAIKAMISQPVTDKRDRTQTEQALAFQILSDDCQIARNTIDKAIAKAEKGAGQ